MDETENFGSNRIFKQEIINWEYTKAGIKKTTTVRDFKDGDHNESFYSSVYPYPNPNSPDLVSLNKDEEDDSDIYASRVNYYKSGGRGTL